jgi:hypothetical protein
MSVDTERPYILTIRGVLGKHECTQLIARIDAAQPKLAAISTPCCRKFDRQKQTRSERLAARVAERLEAMSRSLLEMT